MRSNRASRRRTHGPRWLLANVRAGRVQRTLAAMVGAAAGPLGAEIYFEHLRGVRRKPGGLQEPLYNLVMGPPLLAPGSLALIGVLGVIAPLVPRER